MAWTRAVINKQFREKKEKLSRAKCGPSAICASILLRCLCSYDGRCWKYARGKKLNNKYFFLKKIKILRWHYENGLSLYNDDMHYTDGNVFEHESRINNYHNHILCKQKIARELLFALAMTGKYYGCMFYLNPIVIWMNKRIEMWRRIIVLVTLI